MQKAYKIGFLFIVVIWCLVFSPTTHAKDLKIGFVTDWECSPKDSKNKLSSKCSSYLEEAVDSLNDERPHITIGGGDFIEGSNLSSKEAKNELKNARKIFEKIKTGKVYYVPGNHDFRALSTSEYKDALNINYLHKIIDKNGFRLILLDTNYDGIKHRSNESFVEGYVSSKELAWLKSNIDSSPYPVIIFSHHSPARPNGRRDVRNSTDVATVIEQSGKVLAVISGHNPTQTMEESGGVKYYVVNSLVNSKAKRTHALITIEKKDNVVDFELKQYGKKKKSYTFKKTI